MKKLLFSLILLLGLATASFAQSPQDYKIKGIAIDSTTREPVSFATVILRQGVTNLKAVTTDAKGEFTLTHDKEGNYIVNISFVGYDMMRKRIILGEEKIVDLGEFEMKSNELEEVVVIGQLITTDIDKTSYNTAVDPETPSLTALEMMRKVPMLTVDGNDNLQLKGQSNFKILVNGKASTMMARSYKEVLRSMPASSIKRIEVITNPPAKYDAEGVSGIINIVTERKSYNSYYGQLFTMAETRGMFGGGGYLSASFGKLSISANAFGATLNLPAVASNYLREEYGKDPITQDPRDTFTKTLGESKFSAKMYYASIDASYEIDTFNLISLSFNSNIMNTSSDGLSLTSQGILNGATLSQYQNQFNTESNQGGISAGLDYQRSFPKPDRLFTLSYRMEYNPNGSNFSNKLTGISNYSEYLETSDNNAWSNEHTIQADFFEPINKKNTLEVGFKYILRPNRSNTDTYIDGEYAPDRQNGLDYFQHVTSAYGSYQYKLNKFSFKAGLRAEYTINTGTFHMGEDKDMYNKFFNIIPYATIGYSPESGQSYRLGYSQRLSRPSIWYLNPYLDTQNIEDHRQGNPELTAAVGNVFDLSYSSFSKSLNISVSASAQIVNNPIQEISTIIFDPNQNKNVRYTTYKNTGSEQVYSLYFNGSTPIFNNKGRASINAGANYKILSGGNLNMNNSGWSGNVSGGFYTSVWKDATANFYGGIYFPDIRLQGTGKTQYYYTLSLSQGFFKKKFHISLMTQNPFTPEIKDSQENWGENFRSINETAYKSASYRITLSWSFGQTITEVKKAKRTIRNEDKMEGGSSSGPKMN